MSDKISVGQLQGNNAAYAVDDFRKMVNYETGTNKGYVRFALGQNGKLKLEKFNRKIDLPLSWRSNTSAAHNRAMREKFAAALCLIVFVSGCDWVTVSHVLVLQHNGMVVHYVGEG